MTTRIEIKADGDLPEVGKYAILAAAEAKFAEFLKEFNSEHKTTISGSVRPVAAPRKKTKTEEKAADPTPATGLHLTQAAAAELNAGAAAGPGAADISGQHAAHQKPRAA